MLEPEAKNSWGNAGQKCESSMRQVFATNINNKLQVHF